MAKYSNSTENYRDLSDIYKSEEINSKKYSTKNASLPNISPSSTLRSFTVKSFKDIRQAWSGPALKELPKEKAEKIIQASNIKLEGNNVGVDECKIINLEDDKPASLYTTGLVFCTGLLMIGEEKAAMLHLYEKGEDFINKAFEEVNPNKITILKKVPSFAAHPERLECALHSKAMENIDKLKKRVSNSEVNCEILETIYDEPSELPIYNAALFYKRTSENNHEIITMSAQEMNILNLFEHEKSKEETQQEGR